MSYTLNEWLNLAFRWTHIFAALLWIGATWYFTWLDRRFHTTDKDQVWMVHSGGFYVVEKKGSPSAAHTLHWFKWEAAITWMSGMALLVLVYYAGGLMQGRGIAIGVGYIFVAWLLYDLVLARSTALAAIGGFIGIVASGYFLMRFMDPRPAYMHVGAALGTMMTANVWERIIPAQKAMVKAAREGGVPDAVLAERAKNRSKHNTYMVMPVVAIMISNHFPVATYGNEYNWIILGVLTLIGWAVAHVVRKH